MYVSFRQKASFKEVGFPQLYMISYVYIRFEKVYTPTYRPKQALLGSRMQLNAINVLDLLPIPGSILGGRAFFTSQLLPCIYKVNHALISNAHLLWCATLEMPSGTGNSK